MISGIELDNFTKIEGLDVVEQRMKARLKTFKGTWWLNAEYGVSHDLIFDKKFSQAAEAEISRVIRADNAVIEIEELGVELNASGALAVEAKVKTTEGDLILSENLL